MKVLIIVDMQNDFISGSLGTPEARAIVPTMVERLREYEDGNTLVIFTKDTHNENYIHTQEGKNLPVLHCQYMTEGWSIDNRISSVIKNGNFLTLSTGSVINSRVNKHTFGSIDLAEILRDLQDNIEEIILMGVCTDICVVSNAMLLKAFCPETIITVDASCCAGVTPEAHKAALHVMKSCQINVIGG